MPYAGADPDDEADELNDLAQRVPAAQQESNKQWPETIPPVLKGPAMTKGRAVA